MNVECHIFTLCHIIHITFKECHEITSYSKVILYNINVPKTPFNVMFWIHHTTKFQSLIPKIIDWEIVQSVFLP